MRIQLAGPNAGDSFPNRAPALVTFCTDCVFGRARALSEGGRAAMLTAIGITLVVGVGLGMVLGVPLGRTIERVRSAKPDKTKKKKPRP